MKPIVQIALVILFLAMGAVGFSILSQSAAEAETSAHEAASLSVDVVDVAPARHTVWLEASGVVQPAQTIDLVPEVAGKVSSIAEGLAAGSRFNAGDVIARIDNRDYKANLAQADASIRAAKLELALEKERGSQAQRELQLLGRSTDSKLATREAQIDLRRANLASAEAAWATAKRNLDRTTLVAPFDAIVQAEALDKGQYVAPGSRVATLIGTDTFHVRVSLPVRDLVWLHRGGESTAEGASAMIVQDLGHGQVLQVPGKVLRVLAELDPQTRTAGLLVAIDNPLEKTSQGLNILPGAFVNVRVQGRSVANITEVPRAALSGGDIVWVATSEQVLEARTVDVAWTTSDNVYVRSGLEPDDRPIITSMAIPVAGTPVEPHQRLADAE